PSYGIAPATWAQYWKLSGNARYIDPETTTVSTPNTANQGAVEFTYAVNDDGTVTITGVKTRVASLVVPRTIEDASAESASAARAASAPVSRTVTAIAPAAFKSNEDLVSVVLPETVTTLGAESFAACPKLQTVLIPAQVETIATDAFVESDKLSIVCDEDSAAAAFADERGIPSTSAKPLSLACITCEGPAVYTKGGCEPALTVTIGENELVLGADYQARYSNNTSAGAGTVVITPVDERYSGEQTWYFEIQKRDIASAKATLASAKLTYTGRAQKPAVASVTVAGEVLEAADYKVSYQNNVNAGTATAVITGKGNYTGTKEVTFAIAPASLAGASIYGVYDADYTGKPITPVPDVWLDEFGQLEAGTDYMVAYQNNVKAGTATVLVNGKGNYTGTARVTFTIYGSSTPPAPVQPAPQPAAPKPAPQPTPAPVKKKANPIKVKVRAKTFTVQAKKVKKKSQALSKAKVFKITKAKGAVTFKKASGNKKITISKSGKITVKKGLKKGTYTVKIKVTAKGTSAYNAKTVTVKVKVRVK
ncbi:leucine-rich repeat protein, partial [Eggerthellaceae bacterium 24-137]